MLTGKQKGFLRGLGHNLNPVVMIGKHSVNDKVVEEVLNSLAAHELIKVRVLESCDADRKEVAENLATACNAQVAQILGRTILLYKKGDPPVINLP